MDNITQMSKVSCYDCQHGTWDEERRINDCHHEEAAYAVACFAYNRECPYFENETEETDGQ